MCQNEGRNRFERVIGVTVAVEGVGELRGRFLAEEGRESKLGGRGDGSGVMMVESCLGVTTPPRRRDGEGCAGKLQRVGREMEGSSSSKTAGKGSSSPCSVIRTARRGTGRGAKRILRRLVEATHSGAEAVLEWRA